VEHVTEVLGDALLAPFDRHSRAPFDRGVDMKGELRRAEFAAAVRNSDAPKVCGPDPGLCFCPPLYWWSFREGEVKLMTQMGRVNLKTMSGYVFPSVVPVQKKACPEPRPEKRKKQAEDCASSGVIDFARIEFAISHNDGARLLEVLQGEYYRDGTVTDSQLRLPDWARGGAHVSQLAAGWPAPDCVVKLSRSMYVSFKCVDDRGRDCTCYAAIGRDRTVWETLRRRGLEVTNETAKAAAEAGTLRELEIDPDIVDWSECLMLAARFCNLDSFLCCVEHRGEFKSETLSSAIRG
jgi:hypothetical protein